MPRISLDLNFDQLTQVIDQLSEDEKKKIQDRLDKSFKTRMIKLLDEISDDWERRGVTQQDIDQAIEEVREESGHERKW